MVTGTFYWYLYERVTTPSAFLCTWHSCTGYAQLTHRPFIPQIIVVIQDRLLTQYCGVLLCRRLITIENSLLATVWCLLMCYCA